MILSPTRSSGTPATSFSPRSGGPRKSGSVKVLSHEGQRLAQRMASHPEWQAWWERADDLGDAQAVTGAGVNPFAAVTMEAIAEGLIEENSDARRAYRRNAAR